MDFILQWIDIIWLPLAFFIVHRHQRFYALGCLLSCMLMMRLLTELMESIGYGGGLVGFFDMPVHNRGLAVYSFFYLVYLLLAFYSPRTDRAIFLAASLSIFFLSAFTFAIVMVL